MTELDNLLTTEEAAAFLGIRVIMMARHANNGSIQATKKAGVWLFQRGDVERFAAERPKPGRPVTRRKPKRWVECETCGHKWRTIQAEPVVCPVCEE